MENTIYIQNLERNIDVADLCDAFRSYGKISSANIEYDCNMKVVGKASITFEDYANALNSVKFMNGKKLRNKSIHVSFYIEEQQFKQVFVKNFSRDWSESDLFRSFETIGTVNTVKISEDDDGKSNGYGFVEFKTYTSAKKAIECLNGELINGQKLIVERFKTKSERENLLQNSVEYAETVLQNSVQQNNLFIKNLPKDMTENELKELFKKYGVITSYKIASDAAGQSKGFGFVSFQRNEEADKALKRLNGVIIKGKKLQINFKQDGYARKHYMHLKHVETEIKQKQYKQRSRSASSLQFHPHSLSHTLMKI